MALDLRADRRQLLAQPGGKLVNGGGAQRLELVVVQVGQLDRGRGPGAPALGAQLGRHAMWWSRRWRG
jgi:hypothetical protein